MDNILTFNATNFITVVLMVVLAVFIVGLVAKLMRNRQAAKAGA